MIVSICSFNYISYSTICIKLKLLWFFQSYCSPQLTRFWSITLTLPSHIQSIISSTFNHAWPLKPKKWLKNKYTCHLATSFWTLDQCEHQYGIDQCQRKCNGFEMYGSSICAFVELAFLNFYLVVQYVKQEHKFCCGATPHYYLPAFSKFCYKHTSLEIIHFASSMVQLSIHGPKWFQNQLIKISLVLLHSKLLGIPWFGMFFSNMYDLQ